MNFMNQPYHWYESKNWRIKFNKKIEHDPPSNYWAVVRGWPADQDGKKKAWRKVYRQGHIENHVLRIKKDTSEEYYQETFWEDCSLPEKKIQNDTATNTW